MIIHTGPHLSIYFGDKNDRMYVGEYLDWKDQPILKQKAVAPAMESLRLKDLLFLHQIHSIQGYEVIGTDVPFSFSIDGDFLISQELHIGLGVLAADCLPVVVYDRKHHAIGIAHAGWRGAIGGVVEAMIEKMEKSYGTSIKDLTAFLGPSARRCCYEVGSQFISHLDSCIFTDLVLHEVAGKVFFDPPLFVEQRLLLAGMDGNAINKQYNACTICDTHFHSHRRDQASKGGRQMTVVALK